MADAGEDEAAGLMAIVEDLRASTYPELDSELVGDVLRIQRLFAEDRAEARKRTEQLVNKWAAAQPAEAG